MKSIKEVSVSNDSSAIINRNTVLKSSKCKNSSPQKPARDIDNNHKELENTEATSGQPCNSDLGEEQNLRNEPSQNKQKESNAESGENNSNQKNSVSVNSTLGITPDDEIYTFQCPQNYNKQDLYKVDFRDLKSISSKGGVFNMHLLDSDKKFITLAVPKTASSASLIKLPLKGHIVIQKCVNITNRESMIEDDCDKDKVVFPSDIKVRHPLLGTDWEAHAQLACAAFNRHSHGKKNKTPKKEKIKYVEIVDVDIVDTKKIKHENDAEIVPCKKKKLNSIL